MTAARALYGGVELGGTKCVCILGSGPDDVREQASVATGRDPEVALRGIETILDGWRAAHGPMEAVGIASFGPIDLARDSPNYGVIGATAKPGWRGTAIAGRFARSCGVPVGCDTDVNAAALAEGRWGAARGLADFAYVTVGTGVGVGLVVNGRPVRGFAHAECGHIRIARAPGDAWSGSCAFHGDCVEGLASGPAIAARTGRPPDQLRGDDPVWEYVADALAQLLHTLMLTTAPRRILIGGGVATARAGLLPMIRHRVAQSLGRYLDLGALIGSIDDYVSPPGLGERAGPFGALALAADAVAGN
ncbi:MAG TPA: ROK family protein [Steroidobacteraceae bacterium]|nr:ROK family protein [Steroidobacteraceae bacterium]